MCGIAGLIDVQGATEEDVSRMIACVRYRGRDEAGTHSIDRAIMGHARLAVVDPENGHQPMTNEDGTVWVSFNGEIYNYVELREELKQKGHRFKSRCDTEVLVHLWEEEGERMLSRLIGMFTFFIWDGKQHRGMLARDRQGIKPCFIAEHRGGLAFASEMKSILSLPGWRKEIDEQALMDVFTFNYALPPATCFKGIRHMMPGTYLSFELGKKPVEHRYWSWPFFDERRTPSNEAFRDLVDDVVRIQMRFDVKGGLYLSGGVDSSVVAAHLVKQWNEPSLDGIGLDITEQGYSEYGHSKQVAAALGINLKPALVDPKRIPELAGKVAFHAEQPHGDFSFFLFYQLAEQANHEGKIVMFTGDGPDEALSGFLHNERFFQSLQRMNFSLRKYFESICYMPDEVRAVVLSPQFLAATEDPVKRFQDVLDPWQELEPIEQIMAYECTSLAPGNNLVKGDRMGAAWSTEGRAPFMDHRVSELFTRLPVNQKFHDGYGKYFLKEYAASLFPREFIFRDKTMPTMPIGEWFKGPLYGWAKELLSSNGDERINTQATLKLLDEHREGRANHTRALRTLVMVQEWRKQFQV